MVNAFSVGLMECEDVHKDVISIVSTSELPNGSFLTLGNLASDTTYGATGLNDDVYEATAPADISDPVVVLDISGVQHGIIGGNDYRQGVKQYNLTLPANVPGRALRLTLGDKFWLGDGGFVNSAALVVGQYATLTNGSTQLTASATAGTFFAVKIQDERGFTAGMSQVGENYLCEVVGL